MRTDASVASTLITRAHVLNPGEAGASGPVDVDVTDGVVTAIRPTQGPRAGAIDAHGALILPGLWDAHTHFSTAALIADSVDVAGAGSLAGVLDRLAVAVAERRHDGMVIGFGFRVGTSTETPTAGLLDGVRSAPTVLLSGDLHAVWLNTAACRELDVPVARDGFLVEHEAFELTRRIMRTQDQLIDQAVARAMAAAAARGVVGVVDMEMDYALDAWRRRASRATLALRVEAATYPADLERLVAEGWRTGDDVADRLRVGPLKVILDGSMSSRTALCSHPYRHALPGLPRGKQNHPTEELHGLLARAREAGVQAAVHAIGDEAVHLVLDAYQATRARGSVEHAQFIRDEDVPRFAELGITASVQPAHLLEDQDVVDQIWPDAGDRVFPLRKLLHAGAQLTFGSDAPVSPLDPWLAMHAATNRIHHAEQAVSPAQALAASVRTRVAVGQPADVVLVGTSAGALLAGDFQGLDVIATLVGGAVTHWS